MKNQPKTIYLNIDTGGEQNLDFKDLVGISWCEERIGRQDLKYHSDKVVKDLRKQVKELNSLLGECRERAAKKYMNDEF